MTDQKKPSALYKRSAVSSPGKLDDELLAAAHVQAKTNRYRNHKSLMGWMPAAAFGVLCVAGISFILDKPSPLVSSTGSTYVDISSADFTVTELSESVVSEPLADQIDENVAGFYNESSEIEALAEPVLPEIHQPLLNNQPLYEPEYAQIEEIVVTGRKREESIGQILVSIAEVDIAPDTNVVARSEVVEVAEEYEQEQSGFEASEIPMAVSVARAVSVPQTGEEPELVSLGDLIPGILLEVRYFGSNNFVGESVDGYFAEKALLSEPAASALARVQDNANQLGYGLKVFDAYRPQRAVNHFVRWAENLDDQTTKSQYYPNVDKSELINEGYIAARSGHSRASTIDLTLVDLQTGEELDMGAPFDFFDPISWPSSDQVSEQAKQNRQLLRSLMTDQGFVPYDAEWWHFTLGGEPYPDQYFDIPVE